MNFVPINEFDCLPSRHELVFKKKIFKNLRNVMEMKLKLCTQFVRFIVMVCVAKATNSFY